MMHAFTSDLSARRMQVGGSQVSARFLSLNEHDEPFATGYALATVTGHQVKRRRLTKRIRFE